MGVDFDDDEYGFHERRKDPSTHENQRILELLAAASKGDIGTMLQAVEELEMPRLKAVRPVASYKKDLTLGDPEKYGTALSIEVERYPRIMIRKPPTAKSYALKPEANDADAGPSHANGPDAADGDHPKALESLQTERIYEVEDETAEGGKRIVPKEELKRGYEYGKTAVYVSESDQKILDAASSKCLQIVGFIPWAKVKSRLSSTFAC